MMMMMVMMMMMMMMPACVISGWRGRRAVLPRVSQQ
jgi:hypothetical protein